MCVCVLVVCFCVITFVYRSVNLYWAYITHNIHRTAYHTNAFLFLSPLEVENITFRMYE